ncbi:MAG TPA: tRNA pseudouridine(55) synthase TruB [Candidatus Krumholzibacteria bacterium]|nr:tRNA pseudouridine(55) synthase TruB [Candidatus Krumholzibacteria bacterium]
MTNRFDNLVFVIDKAVGPTSFDVVAAMRRVSGLRKVGHAGTLDPLARGVLLLCTGNGTRAVEHFMDLEKEYEFDVRLGVETSTLDAEGEVVREAPVPDIPADALHAAAASFVGEYSMTPPVYSAIKRKGRRHYELARAGEAAEIEPRMVNIYGFEVLAVDLPVVRCVVRCSRGTYVRSLAKDFGAKLGLPASLTSLTRTRIGAFRLADAYASEKLVPGGGEDLAGVDLGTALDFLPAVVINAQARRGLQFGIPPLRMEVVKTVGSARHGAMRLLDERGELLAVGTRNGDNPRDPLRVCDSFRLYVDAAVGGDVGAVPRPYQR